MAPTPANSAPFPRYSSMRQNWMAGYYELPQVYSGMSFELQRVRTITSRIVKRNGQVWELWSPNSNQAPFLPKCRAPGYIPSLPIDPGARRYDGHFGRFDCLYSPQYSAADIPHWPFLRRPHLVSSNDFAYPAYEPLMRRWEVNPSDPRIGRFRPEYLEAVSALGRDLDAYMNAAQSRFRRDSLTWALRPQYADAAKIAELARVEYWWEAVDKGMGVQRGLREKEGWLTMIDTREALNPLSLEQLRGLEFPRADERYIGVWVNRLHEGTVLRFLYAGIPCFIAHSYASEDRTRADARPQVHFHSDFVIGTDLVPSLREGPYQQLARQDAERLDALERSVEGVGRPAAAIPEDEQRSSSLYLEQLGLCIASRPSAPFKLDGWRSKREKAPSAGSSGPSEGSFSFSAPLLTFPSEDRAGAERAKEDRYAHQEPEKRSVHASRVEWIVPPRVAPRRDRSWTRYELDYTDSGREAFIYRGRKYKILKEEEWFDREKGRRIYFDDFQVPPGVVNSDVWGAPVPHFPFITVDGNKEVMALPSYWMYPSRHPRPLDVGRPAIPPEPEELPYKDG
ncbi:hypothetical protein R3P38DRAFT_2660707, partial [Favolaschia claudopus]